MQITYEKVLQVLRLKGITFSTNSFERRIDLNTPAQPYHIGDRIVRIYKNGQHPIFGAVYTVKEFDSRGFLKTIENCNHVNDPCRVIPYEWLRTSAKSYQPEWL